MELILLRSAMANVFSGLLGWSPAEIHRFAQGSSLEQLSQDIMYEENKSKQAGYAVPCSNPARLSRVHRSASARRPLLDIRSKINLAGLTDVSSAYARDLMLPKGDRQVFTPKAVAAPAELVISSRSQAYQQKDERFDQELRQLLFGLPTKSRESTSTLRHLDHTLPGLPASGVLDSLRPDEVPHTNMRVPQLHKLILDSGKLAKLDKLLGELKAGGHRVLIYFQMTRMIDLMEEYLSFRQHKYLRLDGSSTISERRDMVSDWQTRPEFFIFLLSTRAGGVGINLTAADTVIFYDCDWNPANDAQAMDRCHRIGQTKVGLRFRNLPAQLCRLITCDGFQNSKSQSTVSSRRGLLTSASCNSHEASKLSRTLSLDPARKPLTRQPNQLRSCHCS